MPVKQLLKWIFNGPVRHFINLNRGWNSDFCLKFGFLPGHYRKILNLSQSFCPYPIIIFHFLLFYDFFRLICLVFLNFIILVGQLQFLDYFIVWKFNFILNDVFTIGHQLFHLFLLWNEIVNLYFLFWKSADAHCWVDCVLVTLSHFIHIAFGQRQISS